MANQQPRPGEAPILCSFHAPNGLEYVTLNSAQPVQVKMRNLTRESFPVNLASPAPVIQVDFSQLGGAVSFSLAGVGCTGFEALSFDQNVLTLQLVYSQIWWFENAVWSIAIPDFCLTGSPGLGALAVGFQNLLPEHGSAVFTIPVPRLQAGLSGQRLLGGWIDSNRVAVTPRSGQTQPNSLDFQVLPPQGYGAEFTEGSGAYLGLLSGNWPGLHAIASPDDAAAAYPVSLGEDWTTETLDSDGMPLWRLAPKSGSATLTESSVPQAAFHLQNLVSRHPAGPAYAALYTYGIAGFTDQAELMTVALDSTDVQIASFTASPTSFSNITSPQSVTLQWNVVNASAVTLSGVGVVNATGTLSLQIEETTTFVLTAFDAALDTVVSSSVLVTVSPDLVTRLVPPGGIIAWSGSVASIPTASGWQLCDGTNGTPNLSDKFILGAGGSEAPGASGPADTHTHPISQLSAGFTTSSNGSHTHGMPTNWYARNLTSGKHTSIDSDGNYTSSTQTQSSGSHTHTVTVTFPQFESGVNSGTVRPPWYALCFIMKVPS